MSENEISTAHKFDSVPKAVEDMADQLSHQIFQAAIHAAKGDVIQSESTELVQKGAHSGKTFITGDTTVKVESNEIPPPIKLEGPGPVTVTPSLNEGAFTRLQLLPLIQHYMDGSKVNQPVDILLAMDDHKVLAGKLSFNMSSFSSSEVAPPKGK